MVHPSSVLVREKLSRGEDCSIAVCVSPNVSLRTKSQDENFVWRPASTFISYCLKFFCNCYNCYFWRTPVITLDFAINDIFWFHSLLSIWQSMTVVMPGNVFKSRENACITKLFFLHSHRSLHKKLASLYQLSSKYLFACLLRPKPARCLAVKLFTSCFH